MSERKKLPGEKFIYTTARYAEVEGKVYEFSCINAGLMTPDDIWNELENLLQEHMPGDLVRLEESSYEAQHEDNQRIERALHALGIKDHPY